MSKQVSIIIFNTLQKLLPSGSFARSSSLALRFGYGVYFLKGNDKRQLGLDNTKEVLDIISNNNLQTSCLLFNPEEALRKFKNWQRCLPWIKPHYAIKANPAQPLLNTLANEEVGFDCASRAELETIIALGTNKDSIVYSNPIKD